MRASLYDAAAYGTSRFVPIHVPFSPCSLSISPSSDMSMVLRLQCENPFTFVHRPRHLTMTLLFYPPRG